MQEESELHILQEKDPKSDTWVIGLESMLEPHGKTHPALQADVFFEDILSLKGVWSIHIFTWCMWYYQFLEALTLMDLIIVVSRIFKQAEPSGQLMASSFFVDGGFGVNMLWDWFLGKSYAM